jgi:hypothetical protein
MKAIKIDVANQKISQVNISDYKEIYSQIGNGCNLFCCPVQWENNDVLYADDEALLQESLEGCFAMPDFNYPIVGNAIILGTDDEGESIDVKTKIAELQEKIIWGNKQAAELWRNKAIGNRPEIQIF